MKNMNKEQQHTNSVCKIKANKYFWPELNGKTKKDGVFIIKIQQCDIMTLIAMFNGILMMLFP